MNSIFKLLILLLATAGCTSQKFVITSNHEGPVAIHYGVDKYGVLEKGDSLSFRTNRLKKISAMGMWDNFEGYIIYMRDTQGGFPIRLYARNDIREIKKTKEYTDNGKKINVYHLLVGENNKHANVEKAGYGYLSLTSNEEDVEVYLDNENIGKILDVPFNKKVPAGEHTLLIRKDFFLPVSININVADKEVYPYHFELKDVMVRIQEQPGIMSIIQARGNLTVVTERSDFFVLIEDSKIEAPFQLKDLPVGVYEVRMICSDFEKKLEITINEDQTTFIDLDEL